jgi:ArsR family transcriptional regulator
LAQEAALTDVDELLSCPSVTAKDSRDACCPTDGRSRTLPGTAAQARAVAVFKALADATRLQIFSLIAARPEPICVCDINARFELKQSTVSHHLRVLRDAGLVTMSRRGTWSYYAIDPRGTKAARAALDAALPECCRAAS